MWANDMALTGWQDLGPEHELSLPRHNPAATARHRPEHDKSYLTNIQHQPLPAAEILPCGHVIIICYCQAGARPLDSIDDVVKYLQHIEHTSGTEPPKAYLRLGMKGGIAG